MSARRRQARQRRTPHELTLFAFEIDADGIKTVHDIVETSRRHAYRFVRRWMRDAEIMAIAAMPAMPASSRWPGIEQYLRMKPPAVPA